MSGSLPWDDFIYRVVSTEAVTPVIRELWLAPSDPSGLMLRYLSGQYVLLSDREGRVPQRSYSLANAPRPDGRISLLVTAVPDGPTSTWAHETLAPGDEVHLNGPYGTFVLDDRASPTLLLGAGSGLAPVRALAEALIADPDAGPVTLIFSARTRADRIDHQRLSRWAESDDRFRYWLTLTREPAAPHHERVPGMLAAVCPDLTDWQVFASGPPGFVTGCAAAARALGAADEAVHTEEFFADPQPWTMPPENADDAND